MFEIERVLENVVRCSQSYLPESESENYRTSVLKSNLKISHTKGVVTIAEKMARNVYCLPESIIKIVVLAAAVHDIPGRDKQYVTYGTWIDKNCPMDHGDIGYELLAENDYELLRSICGHIDDRTCRIIADVVKYHSKSIIPEINDDITKTVLNIIVSSDGIDLFRHRIYDDWAFVFSDTVPNEEEVARSKFSAKLYTAFLNLKPGEVLDFSSKTNPIRESPLSEHYVDAILLNYAIANKSDEITRRTIVALNYIDLLYERYINVEFDEETKHKIEEVYK